MSWIIVGVAAVSVIGAVAGQKKKPNTIQYQGVDPAEQEQYALQSNIDSANTREKMLAQANSFQQDQSTSMMEKALPGFSKLQSSMATQATNLAQNPYKLPDDVAAGLTQIANERGYSVGARGQAGQFSLMRDLGVNELQYGQANLNSANSMMQTLAASAPRVSPMSPLNFMLTPEQTMAEARYTQTKQQEIAQGAENTRVGVNNDNRKTWGEGLSGVVGAFTGGGGGGGGGGILGGLLSGG
jgi:hypothetical protein